MESGYPQPLELTEMMKDKEPVWDDLIKKHGLEKIPYKHVGTWQFADFCFHQPSDWILNTNKLRQAGFNGMQVDTDKMFLHQFKEMAENKIIPPPTPPTPRRADLGPNGRPGPVLKTPSQEDDPRHLPPNFYYNMQDYCEQRVKAGARWTWSSLRPGPVGGFNRGSVMNISVSIAVYASICKELRLEALSFPGTELSWNALNDYVDVDLLAEASIYCATHKETANQAFNINTGDYWRWRDVWPKIADFFGMKSGYPQPLELTEMMKDKEPVWDDMIKKHGLEKIPYKHVATWDFADWCFHQPSDWILNTNKLRQAGFNGMKVDTDKMFLRQFKEMAENKIIPSPTPRRKLQPGSQEE
ncbi:hypothetical protein WJX72_004890 [[Myrmecia] bisecta]|uniref:PRISE-like Rossmann-fold domain-containing protein n=1 Tax=[Myrmecia] bisecta TaxID=41462 RepID=A0AAW1PCK6_9CHLO